MRHLATIHGWRKGFNTFKPWLTIPENNALLFPAKSTTFVSMYAILQKQAEIEDLCKLHHVDQLFVFGSALRPDYDPSRSDIDFLVTFLPIPVEDYFDNYLSLFEGLELVLDSEIDIVEYNAIRNPIFKRTVDSEKQLFYDRAAA